MVVFFQLEQFNCMTFCLPFPIPINYFLSLSLSFASLGGYDISGCIDSVTEKLLFDITLLSFVFDYCNKVHIGVIESKKNKILM